MSSRRSASSSTSTIPSFNLIFRVAIFRFPTRLLKWPPNPLRPSFSLSPDPSLTKWRRRVAAERGAEGRRRRRNSGMRWEALTRSSRGWPPRPISTKRRSAAGSERLSRMFSLPSTDRPLLVQGDIAYKDKPRLRTALEMLRTTQELEQRLEEQTFVREGEPG